VLNALEECAKNLDGLAQRKGDLIRELLTNELHETKSQIGVLVRNAAQLKPLEDLLEAAKIRGSVFTPALIPENSSFGALVCISWPNSEAMLKVLNQYASSNLFMVGYGFEKAWFAHCFAKKHQAPNFNFLSLDEQAKVMHLPPPLDAMWITDGRQIAADEQDSAIGNSVDPFELVSTPVRKGGEVKLVEGEEAVEAKYVGFIGDTFSYLTKGHKLPVVTSLLRGSMATDAAMAMRRADGLLLGDCVVFREGGRRDVVHELADRLMEGKAEEVRAIAGEWRVALRNSGLDWSRFRNSLFARHIQRSLITFNNWFFDEDMIGPGTKEDLELIASIVGSAAFTHSVDEVWGAIKYLWGMHQRAGAMLSKVLVKKLPDCLGGLSENGSLIDVEGLITAWVVQIEYLAQEYERVPKNSVNVLLHNE
jgi:hypothetical protein